MRRTKNLVARKADKTDEENASHHLICLHITPRGPDHEAKPVIGRDDFRDILTERPEIAMGVIKVLSMRLRETNRKQ